MADDKTGLQLPLDHLRTFVVAAETGGFTSAGRVVHRTQAAVSMQIKRLESELGQELFHREGRGVRPTQAGEVLLGYARRLLGLHDEALAALVKPDVAGTVRLGAPEDFAGAPLARALARFAKAHPRVRLELHCETTPLLLDLLAAGKLDLTLATSAEGTARAQPGWKTIHRAPLAWAVGRGFDTHLTRPLPLAVYHQGCPYRRAAESALDAAGIPWRAAVSSPSLSGALAAVRAGLGVAPVPRSLVAPDCRLLSGEEELPPLVDIDVTLHHSRARACGPAAALLADLLAEAFADLG